MQLSLYELSDDALNKIINLKKDELDNYITLLIANHYGDSMENNSDMHNKLMTAYTSSFTAEKIYRDNLVFQKGFQAVYSKTGLVTNLVNDLYFTDDHLIVH
tara:strand:+ start:22060 stop:22365 length:306 start_codon:yes stop_codon:yes gene_type:complete